MARLFWRPEGKLHLSHATQRFAGRVDQKSSERVHTVSENPLLPLRPSAQANRSKCANRILPAANPEDRSSLFLAGRSHRVSRFLRTTAPVGNIESPLLRANGGHYPG